MNQQLPPLRNPKDPDKGGNNLVPILAGLGIAVFGLAIAAGLVLLLLSNRETEDLPVIPSPGSQNGKAESGGSGNKAPDSEQRPQRRGRLPRLAQSSPSPYWTAVLPVGSGWSSPSVKDFERRQRTEVRGPRGAIVVVDYTFDERPNPPPELVVSRQPVRSSISPDAEVLELRGGDTCPQGTTCTDYLLPYGAGGYAVLVGWPGKEPGARKLAGDIAGSLTPRSAQ